MLTEYFPSCLDRPNSNMPTFNDYALVPAVPSPSPEQLGPEAVSQLMTWGALMSTPRALGESGDPLDTAPNAFKINEPKRRDDIGRRLAKDASRAMRERAKGYGTTTRGLAILAGPERRMGDMGPPAISRGSIFDNAGGTTPKRSTDSLTPAGRTLLERSMGTPISGSRRSGSNVFGGGAARGRAEAMERTGGWSNLGNSKRKETSTRSW
jgi:protein DGCR14